MKFRAPDIEEEEEAQDISSLDPFDLFEKNDSEEEYWFKNYDDDDDNDFDKKNEKNLKDEFEFHKQLSDNLEEGTDSLGVSLEKKKEKIFLGK